MFSKFQIDFLYLDKYSLISEVLVLFMFLVQSSESHLSPATVQLFNV